MRVLVLIWALGVMTALPAAAQDRSFSFTLRGGVASAPDYPGSGGSEAGADLGLSFGNAARTVPENGVSLRGAFRVIGTRDAQDNPELAGLEGIDAAIELGLGVTFQQTNWLAFGELRKGVTGHSGVTGTLGADMIFRPSERWLVTAGPRVNFGDDTFSDTYFGVPTGGPSSFAAFDAEGGVLGAGVEVSGTYFIDDKWALEGGLSYEKLLGDASDSPITQNGSEDQWRFRLGVSRTFNLNF
ncbi:MAG: MipA/OmpV family protein [Sulfitobacter sp.]